MTVIAGLVLIPLLAVLAVTPLFVGRLVPAHLFVGMLLISPVGPQMATTGYRFVRYHSGGRIGRRVRRSYGGHAARW